MFSGRNKLTTLISAESVDGSDAHMCICELSKKTYTQIFYTYYMHFDRSLHTLC